MRHIFIVNPTSGVGRYQEVIDIVEEYFKDHPDKYEIHFTEYEGHALELSRSFVGDVIVYSVGGDGTAHEILNGLQQGVSMAVIPVGTGNDFWRMVEFDGSLQEIVCGTIEGKTIEIDYGTANGNRFLNCANIGIDAEVNKFVNDFRYDWFPRNLVYIFAAIIEIFRYKPVKIKIKMDDYEEEHKVILTSFMNGKWYGGGFKSAPKAELDDGLLDVCLVENIPLRKIPALMPKYYKGEHLDLDPVTYHRVDEVVIESDRVIPLGCDGEIFKYDTITIRIEKKALPLRIPKSAKLLKV